MSQSLMQAIRSGLGMRGAYKGHHNNRKMTKGRKAYRHDSNSPSWSGYEPNELIRLKKWLRDEKRALEIFEDKPPQYQIDNLDKKFHMEARIEELEEKIENFGD